MNEVWLKLMYVLINKRTRLNRVILSHGFLWFYVVVIALRDHFFSFYQKERSCMSKAKFGEVSHCCKRVLDST